MFGFWVGLLTPVSELKVSPFIALDKCSSIMIFPARPKSHSALSVYFPTGESLLMKIAPLVESKPSFLAGTSGAYASTVLNLNGPAI